MWRKPVIWLPLLLLVAVGVSLLPWSPPVEAEGTTLRGPRPIEWKDFLGVNAQFQYFPSRCMKNRCSASTNWGSTGYA